MKFCSLSPNPSLYRYAELYASSGRIDVKLAAPCNRPEACLCATLVHELKHGSSSAAPPPAPSLYAELYASFARIDNNSTRTAAEQIKNHATDKHIPRIQVQRSNRKRESQQGRSKSAASHTYKCRNGMLHPHPPGLHPLQCVVRLCVRSNLCAAPPRPPRPPRLYPANVSNMI